MVRGLQFLTKNPNIPARVAPPGWWASNCLKIFQRQILERERMTVRNSSSPSLSIKIALIVSLSLTSPYPTTTTSSYFSFSVPRFFLSKPKSSSTPPKATTSDLLYLLGTHQQASSVNPEIAQQLHSCFKFLVPFSIPTTKSSATCRRTLRLSPITSSNSKREEEDNELVWWPPTPVLELARLAVDSGGDPGSIHRALDPTPIPVSN